MTSTLPFKKPKVRLFGDPGEAQKYLGAAYNLMYKVREVCRTSGAPIYAMRATVSDGAIVEAQRFGDEEAVSVYPPSYAVLLRDERREFFKLYEAYVVFPRDAGTPNGITSVDGATVSPDLLILTSKTRAEFEYHETRKAGTVTWISNDREKHLISYDHGGGSRYVMPATFPPWFVPKRNAYYKTLTIETPANYGVSGLGVFRNRLIIAVKQISPSAIHYSIRFYYCPIDFDEMELQIKEGATLFQPTWTLLTTISVASTYVFGGWFFKPDGSEAQGVARTDSSTVAFLRRKIAFDLDTNGDLIFSTSSPTYSYTYSSVSWTTGPTQVWGGYMPNTRNYTLNINTRRFLLDVDYDRSGNEVMAEFVALPQSGASTKTESHTVAGPGPLYWYDTATLTREVNYSIECQLVINGQVVLTATKDYAATQTQDWSLVEHDPSYTYWLYASNTTFSGSGSESKKIIYDLDLRFGRILMEDRGGTYSYTNGNPIQGQWADTATTGTRSPIIAYWGENITTTKSPQSWYLNYFKHDRNLELEGVVGVWRTDLDSFLGPKSYDYLEALNINPNGTPESADPMTFPYTRSSSVPPTCFSCRDYDSFLALKRWTGGRYDRLFSSGNDLDMTPGDVPFLGSDTFSAFPIRTI